jgi:hypothetical protein
MSKEAQVFDSPIIEQAEITPISELVKLDDLSLALIGGGAAGVEF